MHRKTSPIRHDYNTGATTASDAPDGYRRALWFAVGLGIPLVLVALAVLMRGEEAQKAPATPLAASPTVSAPPSRQLPATLAPVIESTPTSLPSTPVVAAPLFEDLVIKIQRGDTLDGLFRANSLNVGDLMTIAQLDAAREPLRMLKPGDELQVSHDDGKIIRLTRNLGIDAALEVSRNDDGTFAAALTERPVEYRQSMRHGRITNSLFESAAAIGLSDRVIMNVAGIFAWDIDFVYDIRSGDEYYVIYEELWQDGQKVSDGEIIAAEFINQGESFQAIRYVGPSGRSNYFNPDGRSVRKAFVRAPVDFKRISSSFNPNRRHPVLNTIRAHRGVDYAAPTGTPIMAAGDGKIIFRGKKNGYGNVVILQHGGNITTLYAHMSNFRRGQRIGTRVKQGQVIGYVGATGLVTAAHLHYEYRLNGVHRNPRTVKLPQAAPIQKEYRQDFEKVSQPILAELERFKRLQMASTAPASSAL